MPARRIDAPPPRIAGKDYVLGEFTPPQRLEMDFAVIRAAEALLTWIEKGLDTAMNEYNQSAAG